MHINDYQDWTISTAIYPESGTGSNLELYYLSLGLASEAGEVAGKVKKIIRDRQYNPGAIMSELSDVLWYVARLADSLGLTMEDLATLNHGKLTKRKEAGTLSGNGDTR